MLVQHEEERNDQRDPKRQVAAVTKIEAIVVRDRVETVMEAVEEQTGHVGITVIDSVGKIKALVWVIVLSQGFLAFEMNLAYYQGNYDPLENTFGGMDKTACT